MHIAVNTRLLLKGRLEGIGRVAHETLRRLVQKHPEVRFTFLFDRPFDPSFIYGENVDAQVLFPPARHPFLYIAWFEGGVAHFLNKHKPDVFFSPDAYLSLRARVPQVPLFHDLAFEHFPQDIGWLHRLHYQTFFPRYAHKAAHIISVSHFTKKDIVHQYGVAPEKITVAWNGGGEQFHPLNDEEQRGVLQKYTHGKPYFLYVGAIHPRKNLHTLLASFDRFKEKTGSAHQLVLTGRWAWQTGIVQEAYDKMKFKDAVIFTGYVPDEELSRLYASAIAVCYVSKFEGFGLPIVEAFKAGTAVITSNVSSMPEIAGEAALCIDPDSELSLTEAMVRMVSEPDLRKHFIAKGMERAHLFSWDHATEVVARVLMGCCRLND